MRRRDFVALIGGAAASWPLLAGAGESSVPRRVGVLMNLAADDAMGGRRLTAFRQALQQLGWTDGSKLQIDVRWAKDTELARKYATELVALAPAVIVAATTPQVAALQQATRTVPIVFLNVVDPVGSGMVASLARPGGNITGFIVFEYALAAKWLQLLKEIAPSVTRAAVLRDPTTAAGIGQFAAIQAAASAIRTSLLRQRNVTNCLPFIRNLTTSRPAAWSVMGMTCWRTIVVPRATLIASSKAQSRLICRCKPRPNTSLRSTSKRPRQLA
jgi:putative ABC transport system substrate-binding protein